MQNFTFWNPTKIVFGKGMIAEISPHKIAAAFQIYNP